MSLEQIFNPKSVVIIGATDRPGSVGSGFCHNLLKGKGRRKVFFVNPNRKKVLNRKTYSSITGIREEIDLVVIAVPAEIVPQIVRETAEKRVGGIIIISAGFAEAGKRGERLQKEVVGIVNKANISLLGPNCLGIIRPSIVLNASFAPATPRLGKIAFVSQSGALINSVLDASLLENYGFSTIISYGNAAGLKISDFLLWLKKDKETKVVALYIEGMEEGRRFMRVLKETTKQKPIVAIKAGKTKSGQRTIFSHTASLAGSAEVFSAVFKQAGVFEVNTLGELFNVAKALAWQPRCKNGIGIITNGGGAGVLAADYCEQLGLRLSSLEKKTVQNLKNSKVMSSNLLIRNPLDIIGDALPERYKLAIELLLSQDNVHGLIVIQTLQIMTESEKNAKMITRIKKKWPQKPIIACFMGGKLTGPSIKLLEQSQIPNYSDPKHAVLAMKALIKR